MALMSPPEHESRHYLVVPLVIVCVISEAGQELFQGESGWVQMWQEREAPAHMARSDSACKSSAEHVSSPERHDRSALSIPRDISALFTRVATSSTSGLNSTVGRSRTHADRIQSLVSSQCDGTELSRSDGCVVLHGTRGTTTFPPFKCAKQARFSEDP